MLRPEKRLRGDETNSERAEQTIIVLVIFGDRLGILERNVNKSRINQALRRISVSLITLVVLYTAMVVRYGLNANRAAKTWRCFVLKAKKALM